MATTTRAWRLLAAAALAGACLAVVAAGATAAPAGPRLATDVGSLLYTAQETGTTSPPQQVQLRNAGDATLRVSAVRVNGGAVAAASYAADVSGCAAGAAPGDVATLAPGASCAVEVRFAPTALGRQRATLVIAWDGGLRALPLEGHGSTRAPVVAFGEGSLEFSPQKLGTASPPQLLTVRNTGNATLRAGSVVARGPFTAAPHGCPAAGSDALTLAPGAACVVRVVFAPEGGDAGRSDGRLEIVSNAPGASSALPVAGTGVRRAPAVSFDQSSLRFAAQAVGTVSPPQAVRLRNTGRATLHVSAADVSGPFSVTAAGCPAEPGDVVTLEAGERCTLAVTFEPAAPAGLRTGSLRLESDAPGAVAALALEGLGTGGPVQAGAGAAGGGYVLLPGAPRNEEAYRERLEFALRVNGDGSVRGKQLTLRFVEGGRRYVLRSTAVDRGSLVVTGRAAAFTGAAVLFEVGPGGVETALPGVAGYAVWLTDVADPGAGLDTFAVAVTAPGGARFHALGSQRAQLPLASGNLGVRLR